jgi:hypothetical protein
MDINAAVDFLATLVVIAIAALIAAVVGRASDD